MRSTEHGFSLLEVLPAMVWLLVVLVTVSGILSQMAGTAQAGYRLSSMEALLEPVCSHFARGEKGLLLAVRKESGWELAAFPDRSWLPDPLRSVHGRSLWLFRVRPLGHQEEPDALLIETSRHTGPAGSPWEPLLVLAVGGSSPVVGRPGIVTDE